MHISVKQVENFPQWAAAVGKWIAAGRPVRSDEEVQTIHKVFCKPCYLCHKNTCLECSCFVRNEGSPIFNKIKMATEHCNLGRW
jgi:hypothetical protein